MTDPTEPVQTAQPKSKNDLIESIYRIALEPQTYDSFMGQWDDFILGQINKLASLQSEAAKLDEALNKSEIANHFAIAMQLLEQAGRPEGNADAETIRSTLPQLVFNNEGTLVWNNNVALNLFSIKFGTTLDHFDLSDKHRSQLHELFSSTKTDRTVLVRIKPTADAKPIPMAFKHANLSSNETLFSATQVRQIWPDNTGELLINGFGLSTSEVNICERLIEGSNIAEIASARKSAVETVRTQMKKILQKMDCSSQVELVGLLHGTMQLAEQENPRKTGTTGIPNAVLNITLEDRIMPVETFGDPKGTPVIFFHGLLDLSNMTEDFRNALKESGFYLLTPARPSFGLAAPDDRETIATAPERFARDIETLIVQTGIERPILLGHMVGAVYAFAAAAHLRDQVRGILQLSSRVPVLSPSQLSSMTARQRVVALTARYAPRILPFLIRAGMSQVDNNGERQFLESLYQHSPCDMRTLTNIKVREAIMSGFRYTTAQGHNAFVIDSYHSVRDWSRFIDESNQKIEILHGVEDPVIDIKSIDDLAQRLGNRATLTKLEDVGQLLIYEHPKTVVKVLERLRDL